MGRADMTLTKVKLYAGGFDYINLDLIQFVDVLDTHYEVYVSSSVVIDVDLTDATITGLIGAADTAYGA